MSALSTKRLTKELADIRTKGTPAGISLVHAEDLACWVLAVEVLGESVYQGERFGLQFVFDKRYPIESPQVGLGGGVDVLCDEGADG